VVLRVRGKREWRVQPLGLVPVGGDPAEAPAVRLIVDRIRGGRVLEPHRITSAFGGANAPEV
jgi:hypothetical protein